MSTSLESLDALFASPSEIPYTRDLGAPMTRAEWSASRQANGPAKGLRIRGYVPAPDQKNLPTPVKTLYGENALFVTIQSLTRLELGEVDLDAACTWSEGRGALPVSGPYIVGAGCHAKVYLFSGKYVILSSQNNGASPLCEFAISFDNRSFYKWWHDQLSSLASLQKRSP